MNPNIQNIAERKNAVGDISVEAKKTATTLANSSNIDINGVASAVEGGVKDLVNAVASPLTSALGKINSQIEAALNTSLGGVISSFQGFPPWPNTLEKFASYNYNFTLGCLTDDEINNPDKTYRVKGPSVVILKSGGSARKKVLTQYETEGACEFFIEDVNIGTVLTPTPKTRQTNAVSFNFKVLEPYSMGMFLQTLQLAALQAGHKNYIQAPFILTLEFKGYDSSGRIVSAPGTKRYFPIKIINSSFNVTEGGSTYDVDAIPWNHQALTDNVQTTKNDIVLQGRTIEELLQSGASSLSAILNTKALALEEAKQIAKADNYVFVFPNKESTAEENVLAGGESDSGATTESSSGQRELSEEQKQKLYDSLTGIQNGKIPADFDAKVSEILGVVVKRSQLGEAVREYAENPENINDIGKAKVVKDYLKGGKVPFGEAKFSEIEDSPGSFKRGKLTISDEGSKLTFVAGTKIQEIIEELILISDYGRQLSQAVPDENNMIPWFMIETHVYNASSSETVDATGAPPKVYVYRIVPYKVSASRFSPPSKPMANWKQQLGQAAKVYNYIYTGENKDILEFDIEINTAFFLAIQDMRGQASLASKEGAAGQMATTDADVVTKQADGDNSVSSSGTTQTKTTTGAKKTVGGDGALEDPQTQVARDVNEAIVNSPADLVVVNFTIMGDPYYIADSGIGNYTSKPDPTFINITKDGSVNYQSSETDIIINFRTPIDYQGNGNMHFPDGGFAPVGAFSGLYQVVMVENKFDKGIFQQDLQCVRRRNQETDNKLKGSKLFQELITSGNKENQITETNSSEGGAT